MYVALNKDKDTSQSGGDEELKEPLAQDIDAESDSDDTGMSFKASYKSKHEGYV